MTEEDSFDELINRIKDEKIDKSKLSDEEIKKRKPKPFRYITYQEEIEKELSVSNQKTVMTSQDEPKIIDNNWQILSLGNNETIENIVRRHIVSRKFK
ncbi:MAG: hypothetical protein JSV67_06305 [Thermoplasmatales archaeon]|jgi:hypothetical protein|nr:MAG: hypothetical protein JSV67_06305 [Thermoplasmatales archaeon]